MKISVIIPVKPFAFAKSRLSAVLSPEQRMRLAEAMLRDVLKAVQSARSVGHVFVVSNDPQVAFIAGQAGARIIDDTAGELSAALEVARTVIRQKTKSAPLLILPSDLPLATAADIDVLCAGHPRDENVTIVPAHDFEGTNALLMGKSAGLPFAFGPDSFSRHTASAKASGLPVTTLEIDGLAYDLDHPADLTTIAQLGAGSHTSAVLEELGYLSRLEKTGAV